MFKKGDYIVYLNKNTTMDSFIRNHIYKQREDYDYLRSEVDSLGSKVNGTDRCLYHHSNNWRYATYYEIINYNMYNKPYEVTKLKDPIVNMFDNLDELEKKYE